RAVADRPAFGGPVPAPGTDPAGGHPGSIGYGGGRSDRRSRAVVGSGGGARPGPRGWGRGGGAAVAGDRLDGEFRPSAHALGRVPRRVGPGTADRSQGAGR